MTGNVLIKNRTPSSDVPYLFGLPKQKTTLLRRTSVLRSKTLAEGEFTSPEHFNFSQESQKRGHNVSCDLFFGFRQEIKMLGRSEFALRQGFAAQNACTAQKRRFFGSSGQRGEQGASEARKRPSEAFGARCACRGVITPRASLVARSKKEVTTYVVTSFLERATRLELATSTLARWRSTR